MQKINFEDMQTVIKNSEIYLIINTLTELEQDCLIPHTIGINKEAELINKFLKTGNKQVKIIIYGKNCNDESIQKKYNQFYSQNMIFVMI